MPTPHHSTPQPPPLHSPHPLHHHRHHPQYWVGACTLLHHNSHTNEMTRSYYVYPMSNRYKCFSSNAFVNELVSILNRFFALSFLLFDFFFLFLLIFQFSLFIVPFKQLHFVCLSMQVEQLLAKLSFSPRYRCQSKRKLSSWLLLARGNIDMIERFHTAISSILFSWTFMSVRYEDRFFDRCMIFHRNIKGENCVNKEIVNGLQYCIFGHRTYKESLQFFFFFFVWSGNLNLSISRCLEA